MKCSICNSESEIIFTKSNYDYYECSNCKSLFIPYGIDQSNMVGGGFELERNTQQNHERLQRFIRYATIFGTILDYGCGNGMLVDYCNKREQECDGYDKFNPKYDKIPNKKYNLVSMVEVIEHTFKPFSEIDEIYNLLLPNGILYIETSFVDIANEENILLNDFFYIEPKIGHCTIFSHKGLDILMESKGFKVLQPINRNVRIYQKI